MYGCLAYSTIFNWFWVELKNQLFFFFLSETLKGPEHKLLNEFENHSYPQGLANFKKKWLIIIFWF